MSKLFLKTPVRNADRVLDGVIPVSLLEEARSAITQWVGYHATPLKSLPGLASELGLSAVYTKYEAPRFGLGSFKALGGAFAVDRALRGMSAEQRAATTVVTASDGNHGLSVAWGARRNACACRIYLHENVHEDRAQLIREQGAIVVRVPGNYDDSTHQAQADAMDHGWILVSDTAISPDDDAPQVVMAGYTVMVEEIIAQLDHPPTHVVVQGGCGGLAAAVFGAAHDRWAINPMFVIVEPDKADCLYRSAVAGTPTRVHGDLDTIMGGLSVGEVSLSAWTVIERTCSAFMIIPDQLAIEVMRAFGVGAYGDAPLLIGDSGVAGLAGLIEAARDPQMRRQLGLGPDSRVLTIVTEGAVDRSTYQRLTRLDPAAVAAAGVHP